MVTRQGWLLAAERACWALGLAGLVWWGAYQLGSPARCGRIWSVSRRSGVTPDQSLWSPHRVSAWRQALSEPAPAPLAVLRIPKIRLEVAVLPGTDDRTLDRGVGHIEDTAQPGTDGNLGIAGHRDGFFRGLKDITPGDADRARHAPGNGRLSRRANVGGRARKTSRCWTRRPHGRSRWSPAIPSTSSAPPPTGSSSVPCVSATDHCHRRHPRASRVPHVEACGLSRSFSCFTSYEFLRRAF